MANQSFPRILLASLALALCFTAAQSRTAAVDTLERIRAMLVAGDARQLSEGVAELRAEAASSGDAEAFWTGFEVAFSTSRAASLQTIATWRDAEPGSALAMAAEAVARMHLARLALPENAGNGEALPLDLINRAITDRTDAGLLALRAIEAEPDVLAAYGVAFEAMGHFSVPDSAEPLLASLLSVFATRHSMQAAIRLFQVPRGRIERLVDNCVRFAGRVEGYGPELCLVDVAFETGFGGALRAAAGETLASLDDPAYDEQRFRAYLRTGLDRIEADKLAWAIAYHRASLGPLRNPAEWFDDARTLARGTPDYLAEARLRAIEALRAWLHHDPLDSHAAATFLHLRLAPELPAPDTAEVAELRSALFRGMHFGRANYDMWVLGFRVHPDRPADAAAFLINWLVVSRNNPAMAPVVWRSLADFERTVRERADAEDTAPAEPSAAIDGLEPMACPLARVARMALLACGTGMASGPNCNGHTEHMVRAAELDRRLKEGDFGPDVARLPLGDLAFRRPVPIPELDAFLLDYDRGLD